MPVFAYRAQDAKRREVTGAIAGDSAREARTALRDRGLKVVEISERRTLPPRRTPEIWRLYRGSSRQVVSSLSDLATLLNVGVPMLESLDTLLLQHRGRFATRLMHLRERVRDGSSLANAMRQQPGTFDELSIAMVEVGENSGNLDEILRQYADFQQKFQGFKDRILSSLLYPLVVFSAAVTVSVFLMTVVVPMLLTNLARAGRTLPWPTRILKAGSDALYSYGGLLAIFAIAGGLLALSAASTHRGRRLWNRCLLRIPIIGNMSRKQEISRVSLVIATLLRSGLDFLKSLDIARTTSRNILLREALAGCAEQIKIGKEIGTAVATNSFFPPVVVQVFALGQRSGQLDEMLSRLAIDLDQQVETTAARLSSTLEPALILALSIFVGFILFATLLPILESGNVL